MKSFKEFVNFTNLKGNVKSLAVLLILSSLIYCAIQIYGMDIVYKSDHNAVYFLGLYMLVIGSAYVFMLILFQFLRKKREDTTKLIPKKYFGTICMVQSIYFICLIGGGITSYYFIVSEQVELNYVITVILILCILFYIPMQIFSIFFIYDGKRNPFLIIKDSFLMILRHYQSVFYSFIAIVALYALFYSCMNGLFQISISIAPASLAMNIMTNTNPFIVLFQLIESVFANINILLPAVIALIYGIIMCIALCYYYMVMLCIYDNDIKV